MVSMLSDALQSWFQCSKGQRKSAHTSGESILEDLLKPQELENAQVDRGMESETALVWAESGVELHAEAIVDAAFAFVVFPRHAELNDALGD